MAGSVKVLRGVSGGRRIAAECSAARLAGAQMHPLAARLHAFLADGFVCFLQGFHLKDMRADLRLHGYEQTR